MRTLLTVISEYPAPVLIFFLDASQIGLLIKPDSDVIRAYIDYFEELRQPVIE